MNIINIPKVAEALFHYKCDSSFFALTDEQKNECKKLIRESESARMIASMYEADKLRKEATGTKTNNRFQLTYLAASSGDSVRKEYSVDHYDFEEDGSKKLVHQGIFKITIDQVKDEDGDFMVIWKFDETNASRAFMDEHFGSGLNNKVKLHLISAQNTLAQITELASELVVEDTSQYQHESLWGEYCLPPSQVDKNCSFYIEMCND